MQGGTGLSSPTIVLQDNNSLTGTLPMEWDPSLHELILSTNSLNGTLPRDWDLPASLEVLGEHRLFYVAHRIFLFRRQNLSGSESFARD